MFMLIIQRHQGELHSKISKNFAPTSFRLLTNKFFRFRPLLSDNVLSKKESLGSQWILGRVELNVNSAYRAGSLKIRFEGEVGRTSSSDIALDDICFANGPCG